MRRLVLLVAAAALAAAWYLTLPPRAAALPPAPHGLAAAVRGAMHVHTERSDGTGTVQEVAAAARRAGLQFVVLTDHGDGTRAPLPPAYIDGVLCLDGVEISTQDGHVVAVGLGEAPYRLGGEARDVVEDVRRMGAIAIAAHPMSPKPDLAWRAWDVPIDGLEWLNVDSEWRDEGRLQLARALFVYPARKPETIASVLDRPDETLRRWDRLGTKRQVIAVAAADAHARLGLRTLGEPYDTGASLSFPAYEQVFRALSIGLQDVTLSGDAAADAAVVVGALRAGRVYSTVDAIGGPASFSFVAHQGGQQAAMGDVLATAPMRLQVNAQAPPNARLRLLRDGAEIFAAAGGVMNEHFLAPDPGVYRVEIALPGAPGEPPVPWIVSNPVFVGLARPPAAVDPPQPPSEVVPRYTDGPATGWLVETSARSLGALDIVEVVKGTEIGFRWGLGGAPSESPFAALLMPVGEGLAGYDRLLFTGRASRPMRISVQVRAPGGTAGERWHRSVYLDQTPRSITIRFDDMRPRGRTAQARPELARVQSILFVVDAVNAETGTNGQFFLDDVRYAR